MSRAQGVPAARARGDVERKIERLIAAMTLEEKAGQMTQSAGPNTDAIGAEQRPPLPLEDAIRQGGVGSMIALIPKAQMREYQRIAVEESRLGIPLLFCQDVIHGHSTVFPMPLASACSFDLRQVESSCRVAAREAAGQGIKCTFSPMLDIGRDPRWGRVCEGAGEDPYLTARMAEAHVRGYQGDDAAAPGSLLACLKHFVGYSAAEGGRDYNTCEISPTTLRNVYLPPFRAGIAAGAGMVMAAFNVLDGVPVVANRAVSHHLLREELGFEGVLVSDYAAVDELIAHGVAQNAEEAALRAVLAGLDIEMTTSHVYHHLPHLVRTGKLPESRLDESVRRILRCKFRLGIMDDPYQSLDETTEASVFCPAHRQASLEMARRSMVLLQNKGALPLNPNARIALIGPMADSKNLLGTWHFSRYTDETVTLKDGLERLGANLICRAGCAVDAAIPGGIEAALEAAKAADVILLALGEREEMSGEAASRQAPELPAPQMELARAVAGLGKPVVLVLTSGRPLILEWFTRHADAILETWFLGSMAGEAIADVLFGRCNPSGKLAISFPRQVGQIPVYYNCLNTGRPYQNDGGRFFSRYLDGPNAPLYAFGHGLSYTQFALSALSLSSAVMPMDGGVVVRAKVKNTGGCAGEEVVQLYVRDRCASISRPVRELKGFIKLALAPGQEETVAFTLCAKDLGFYGQDGQFVCEPGLFDVMVGRSSDDSEMLSAILEVRR